MPTLTDYKLVRDAATAAVTAAPNDPATDALIDAADAAWRALSDADREAYAAERWTDEQRQARETPTS